MSIDFPPRQQQQRQTKRRWIRTIETTHSKDQTKPNISIVVWCAKRSAFSFIDFINKMQFPIHSAKPTITCKMLNQLEIQETIALNEFHSLFSIRNTRRDWETFAFFDLLYVLLLLLLFFFSLFSCVFVLVLTLCVCDFDVNINNKFFFINSLILLHTMLYYCVHYRTVHKQQAQREPEIEKRERETKSEEPCNRFCLSTFS